MNPHYKLVLLKQELSGEQAEAFRFVCTIASASAFALAAGRALAANSGDKYVDPADRALLTQMVFSHAGELYRLCLERPGCDLISQAIGQPMLGTSQEYFRRMSPAPRWARLAMHIRGQVVGHHGPKLLADMPGYLSASDVDLWACERGGKIFETSFPFVHLMVMAHLPKAQVDYSTDIDSLYRDMNLAHDFLHQCGVLMIALLDEFGIRYETKTDGL